MRFAELVDLIKREIGEDRGRRLCDAICDECAGEEIYIPKRPGAPEVKPTDTPATVARRNRVSRSTAYNWVTKYRA